MSIDSPNTRSSARLRRESGQFESEGEGSGVGWRMDDELRRAALQCNAYNKSVETPPASQKPRAALSKLAASPSHYHIQQTPSKASAGGGAGASTLAARNRSNRPSRKKRRTNSEPATTHNIEASSSTSTSATTTTTRNQRDFSSAPGPSLRSERIDILLARVELGETAVTQRDTEPDQRRVLASRSMNITSPRVTRSTPVKHQLSPVKHQASPLSRSKLKSPTPAPPQQSPALIPSSDRKRCRPPVSKYSSFGSSSSSSTSSRIHPSNTSPIRTSQRSGACPAPRVGLRKLPPVKTTGTVPAVPTSAVAGLSTAQRVKAPFKPPSKRQTVVNERSTVRVPILKSVKPGAAEAHAALLEVQEVKMPSSDSAGNDSFDSFDGVFQSGGDDVVELYRLVDGV